MGPWRDIWNPFSGGSNIFFIIIGFLSFFPSLSPFLSIFPSFFFSPFFFQVCACGVLQHPKHPPGHANEMQVENSDVYHETDFNCLCKFEQDPTWIGAGFRDRSQTLVRGAWCKKYLSQKFFGPPFRPQKTSGPPFSPWKLWVNPIEKHVNSIFNGKSVVIFSRPPLQGSKILRAPFCISPPLTKSVCERSLNLNIFFWH